MLPRGPWSADDTLVSLPDAPTGGRDWLSDRARDHLERTLRADLSELTLLISEDADRFVRSHGADAVAAGADVYFRKDTYRPDSREGLRLIAHEIEHVLQQSALGNGSRLSCEGRRVLELQALAAADSVVDGRCLQRPVRLHVRKSDAKTAFVQRHASWEHRLLGDAATADLVAIANNQPQRQQLLTSLLAFLNMWHTDPGQVTEQMIANFYPDIRTLRLDGTNLLVTYGELNTLPDYMANPGSIFGQPQNIMLPILQAVRQEGYNNVQRLLGGGVPAWFAGAVAINTGWSFADLLLETQALDNLTWNLGPNHTNHYTALVSRNACHFAPYSWYRWARSFAVAQSLAEQAFQASDPTLKARLTYMAWMNHGYADHFLQDSFAAGHLVNKTFVMQWFIEWAADKWYVPIADWDKVQYMTTARQPGVAAPGLYDMANPGYVFDPQTAEEQATLQSRMDTCGIEADGSTSQAQAYQNYLAFLNGTVVQAASGALHDYFNARSLWVSSVVDTTPYQIWGDDTLLNGGDGVRIASETAHASQQSIIDLLTTGTTATNWQDIANRFPTKVRAADGSMVPLQQWQWSDEVKSLAWNQLFPAVHYYILRLARPRIGYVSVDSPSAIFAPAGIAEAASLLN